MTARRLLWATVLLSACGGAAQTRALDESDDTAGSDSQTTATIPDNLEGTQWRWIAAHCTEGPLDLESRSPHAALTWLQGTLMGNVATTVAVMAVAMVGFMMLTGRINWRFGATVILGCFILFGAASIVAGIQSTVAVSR